MNKADFMQIVSQIYAIHPNFMPNRQFHAIYAKFMRIQVVPIVSESNILQGQGQELSSLYMMIVLALEDITAATEHADSHSGLGTLG